MVKEIGNIRIPYAKSVSTPNSDKLQARINFIKNGGMPLVVIDKFNTLLDGYISYLAYKSLGYSLCPVELVNINEFNARNRKVNYKSLNLNSADIDKNALVTVNNQVINENKIKNKNTTANFKLVSLYLSSNGKCYICGRQCIDPSSPYTKSNLYPTADHIVPRCKGGDDSNQNKALCCQLCNNLKGQFTYSEELKAVICGELKERGLL